MAKVTLRDFPETMAADEMIAVFPSQYGAGKFYERLLANPGGDFAMNVRRNRRNGRRVTWLIDVDALRKALRDPAWTDAVVDRRLAEYRRDMAQTVGVYGTSPAGWAKLNGTRTPDGSTSDKVAYLNGVPCPPEY